MRLKRGRSGNSNEQNSGEVSEAVTGILECLYYYKSWSLDTPVLAVCYLD